MAERRSPDPSSSRVPVHSALVQKSVTAITNPAGRLSIWMLGKTGALGKWKTANSWQAICNQSNLRFTNGLATVRGGSEGIGRLNVPENLPQRASDDPCVCLGYLARTSLGPRKDLILLTVCEFILRTQYRGPKAESLARRRHAGEV